MNATHSEARTTRKRLLAEVGLSTRAEIGTAKASASADRVEIVGDFVPRSMSEIIDEETPLRAASARNVSPSCSRRPLMASATRAAGKVFLGEKLAIFSRYWTLLAP